MSSKYNPFTNFLSSLAQEEITLTFDQIEKILGFRLPQVAYSWEVFWNNNNQHYARLWLRAGWVVASQNNISTHIVRFQKDSVMAHSCLEKYKHPVCAIKPQPKQPTLLIPRCDAAHLTDNGYRYFTEIQVDSDARYRSWEHCYQTFQMCKAEQHLSDKNTNDLCLHLAWYLASWGMLRNSFLMNYDYQIHAPVIRLLFSARYTDLFEANIHKFTEETYISKIMEISDEISKLYAPKNNGKMITDTLVTKILLGTMGCVPAYDSYFKAGLRSCGFLQTYGVCSLKQISTFYMQNADLFEKLREKCSCSGVPYPPMKILDMCFWQQGVDLKKEV